MEKGIGGWLQATKKELKEKEISVSNKISIEDLINIEKKKFELDKLLKQVLSESNKLYLLYPEKNLYDLSVSVKESIRCLNSVFIYN